MLAGLQGVWIGHDGGDPLGFASIRCFFMYGLTGVGPDGKSQPFKIGHFFLAINIEFFVPLEEFKHTTGKILRDLRGSTKAPGQARIYTAGEKEYEMALLTKKRGIQVIPNLQKEIDYLRKELNLTGYNFPF